MSLPNVIEIVPPPSPLRAQVTVPGSKSITNRALILAALANGSTRLNGALWSEDTQVMVDCLRVLGFEVQVLPDAEETANRAIQVQGLGGRIPAGGSQTGPCDLFVGNAGTAARFLAALVCLGEGVYRLRGVPRMHERPQAGLFASLRQLGYRIDSPNDRLPALIHGGGRKQGSCAVSILESSQYASALLLSAAVGGWTVRVEGENAEESPYVAMTTQLAQVFPRHAGIFEIEADASSGSYFWAASDLGKSPASKRETVSVRADRYLEGSPEWSVCVRNWPASRWQVDATFPEYLARMARVAEEGSAGSGTSLPLCDAPLTVSRQHDLGDSIMTLIAMSPLAPQPVRFTDLGRLRLQECERVAGLRTELTKCRARIEERGDTLEVFPSALRGAEIETYQDHRMAMCFAILGLKVPGIRIKNPACVKKTFPNFFQKLAAPPPAGLGVVICEPGSGRALRVDELFAD